MLQLGRELDLAPESLAIDPRGEFRREDLDHHLSVQRSLGGQKHSAHTAARQLALQFVLGAESLENLAVELVGLGHRRRRG